MEQRQDGRPEPQGSIRRRACAEDRAVSLVSTITWLPFGRWEGVGDWSTHAYWPSFLWGLAVLAAFVGWGSVVSRSGDLALRAAWGMAVVVGTGGVAAALSIAKPAVMLAVVVAGFLVGAVRYRPGRLEWAACLLLAAVLACWYAPAVAWIEFEPYDDYLAYFPFVRRLFETGTLIEPFSLRRLAAYGGQSWLHALTTLFGSEKNMNLLDRGIAPVVLAGLVYGMSRERWGAWASAAAGLGAVLIPIARQNTMSQATGVVLWVALFRSMGRSPVAAGLVAGALCALRTSYIPAVGLALLLCWVFNRKDWRIGIVAACAVAPWAVLLWRSSGTFVYPLVRGNQRADFAYGAGVGFIEHVQGLVRFLAEPAMIVLLLPIVVAVVFRGAHRPFMAAAVVSLMLIVWSLPVSDAASVFRYVQPIALGSVFIALWGKLQLARSFSSASSVSDSPRSGAEAPSELKLTLHGGEGWRRFGSERLFVLAAAPMLLVNVPLGIQQRVAALAGLPGEIADNRSLFDDSAEERYRHICADIPAGATVYAAVPLPSLLDYGRHRVFNADLISAASSPPGLPFFRGAEAFRQYLAAEGVTHILVNDFDHPSLDTGYSRSWWRDEAPKLHRILAPLSPYVLDAMNNMDAIGMQQRVVSRSGDLRLIRLDAAESRPSRPSQSESARLEARPQAR